MLGVRLSAGTWGGGGGGGGLAACTWWREAEQREEYCTNWHGASSPSRPGCPGSPFSPLNPRKPCLQRWPRHVTGREADDLWPLRPSSTMNSGVGAGDRGGAAPVALWYCGSSLNITDLSVYLSLWKVNQWALACFVLVGICWAMGRSSSSAALSDLEGRIPAHSSDIPMGRVHLIQGHPVLLSRPLALFCPSFPSPPADTMSGSQWHHFQISFLFF